MSDSLKLAAGRVDIIDTAGRILADPERQTVRVTKAEILALAWAAENFWAVCVEAELLVNALAMPVDGNTRDHAIQTQTHMVKSLMAAMRGETPAPEKE